MQILAMVLEVAVKRSDMNPSSINSEDKYKMILVNEN
jgi:hypothetical protein